MAIKKSELYSSLWASCDELRGGMDASQYKDYVLVMLFIKYISDKWAGQPYAPITIPEGASFHDMTLLKGKTDIGDQINKKIIAPLKEANNLSDMPDFDDPVKLGEGKEKVDRLTNLIAIFEKPELDFSKNRAEGDDILGDAYEYLMRHFATESGKSKGQFYTPAEVSRIMAMIIGIHDANSSANTTVYDPTCGSGSLLLRIGTAANTKVTLYGQEKDSATSALARMNMILHDYPTAEIKQGNTLAKPLFEENGNMKQFDYVVANPPFSDKRWSNGLSLPEDGKYNRFDGFGIPPSKNGDFAYLLHIIRSLKRNGKGAVILPHGVLFRGNAEAEIRKNLIKRGYIKGIIGLPANLFFGTGIPACIVCIDKENAQNRKAIFMINASDGFIKDGPKNRLREQDIRRITDVFNNQEIIEGYSKIVSIASIEENEYNLNIPRYIDGQEKEDIQDIDAHLNGGIPNVDIDALDKYWKVYPTLKADLYSPEREGYSTLKVAKDQVNSSIYEHPEFVKFMKEMDAIFKVWETETYTYLNSQGKDCHPKQIIAEISESLLNAYENKPLVDNYNVYQHLLSYWNETMQDDAYIISYDGWKAETYRILKENSKKKMVDKGWTCDLIPKELVINRFFEAEKLAIEILNTELENTVSQYQELEEEHGAEESALYEVSKKTDAVTNLEEFTDLALSKYFPDLHKKQEQFNEQLTDNIAQLNEQSANRVFDGLKNAKGNLTKTAVAKAYKAMVEDAENAKTLKQWLDTNQSITDTKKALKTIAEKVEQSIQAKIDKDKTQEYIFELTIINQYIAFRDAESDIKKQIKEKEQVLDDSLYAKYPDLTEEEIKALVINDKWLTTIKNAIGGEIDQISQLLTNRIKELAERYDTPLPKSNQLVTELENTVNAHLEKMGFAWN
ncbi:type I restriction-modification system subunit M [Constantimarinum furrinae]|uniref:site-specific DNA-methyltransferase (adenine-specific) n=1 Tax=Constantimarinum furrinae TaxID=2562285 RepID=A0A7G8PRS9_9FLAO|nr:type I restriction-modification system subunit M [Constantimarinum furrinae]QNJ97045.1 type I restriction enzyme M protein [Constantimarinum furrinae]